MRCVQIRIKVNLSLAFRLPSHSPFPSLLISHLCPLFLFLLLHPLTLTRAVRLLQLVVSQHGRSPGAGAVVATERVLREVPLVGEMLVLWFLPPVRRGWWWTCRERGMVEM